MCLSINFRFFSVHNLYVSQNVMTFYFDQKFNQDPLINFGLKSENTLKMGPWKILENMEFRLNMIIIFTKCNHFFGNVRKFTGIHSLLLELL